MSVAAYPIADWDDAYANTIHIPDGPAYPPRWAAQAQAFREEQTAAGKARVDLAYGPAPRNRLDLFYPEGPQKGLVVFIHGGFWKAFDKSSWSHLAAGSRNAGFAIDERILKRDVATTHEADESVRAAWASIYREPRRFWELYELAEKLVDFEDYFRRWRFNHVTTVERVIGFKRGTGGTSGVSYLRRMLDVVLFPELWQVRTDL